MDIYQLIKKRKDLWNEKKDIHLDEDYREAVADFIISEQGADVRVAIKDSPELLIELMFVIVDKEQRTIPFFLNEVQLSFVDKINNDKILFRQGKIIGLRYLVLKGRQQGFTSLINAYQLAVAITNPNFSGYTLADDAENTEAIFTDKGQFYFDNLPDKLKPSIKYKNRRELDFSTDTGGGLNSKWRVATAGNIDAGRSKTLSFFHGCLSGDSKILQPNGKTIFMEDILVGDKVITSSGDVGVVSNKWGSGVKEVFNVNMWLSNEPIQASKDHKILTDNGYKTVEQLTNKDYVALPKITLTNEITGYSYSLPNLDRQQGGGSKHIGKATIPLDYDFGYFLGYYLAEGHIKKQHSNNKRYSSIEFAYEKDEMFIENAYKFASKYTTSRKDLIDEGANRGRTVFYGTFLAHLTKSICGRVEKKKIPEWIFKTNEEFVKGIVAGYFSGDGSKTQEKANGLYNLHRIKATSIRETIARPMRKLVMALGYGVPSLRYKEDVFRYDKRVNSAYTLDACGRCALEIQKLVGIKHEGTFKDRSVKYKLIEGQYYVRVKSIEFNRVDETYDIEVNHKDHNFETTIGIVSNSEVAFWADAKNILIGLSEAFTKNCIVILESTANGYNEFKNLWDGDNNYINLFYEWWKTKEYVQKFEDEETEFVFKQDVTTSTVETDDADTKEWVYARCKSLIKQGLDWEQVYWYYIKWKDKGESIKQEYPCTPQEAFLASGQSFFNTEIVNNRKIELANAKKPTRGYYTYEYANNYYTNEKTINIETIQWVEDNEMGYVELFDEAVDTYMPYTIGADTAGDGSDSNIAQLIDNNQNQVAKLTVLNDEDIFTEQLFCLGIVHNEALIGVETNFSTYVNNRLNHMEYPNIYVREIRPDAITKQTTSVFGFNTNRATRPIILANLKLLVKERVGCIRDLKTLDDMLVFVVNEKGRPEAMKGEHDDTVIALAIALYIQDQQVDEIKPPPDKLEGFYLDSELEDMGYTQYQIMMYKEGMPLEIKYIKG